VLPNQRLPWPPKIVVEWNGSRQPLAIHKVPFAGPYENQQIASLEAFYRINGLRFRVRASEGYSVLQMRRFVVKFADDFEMDLAQWDRSFSADKNPLRLVPTIEHQNVWAFYEAIGYDRKTKKLKDWE